MAALVLTAIGDDRAGLVDALSGVIARHGGNWEQSHMGELAGKFAGVVLLTVPDANVDALIAGLEAIGAEGHLQLVIERARAPVESPPTNRLVIRLLGQDHAGIVHEISHALAAHDVSIDELDTEVVPAPMGGHLFRATATLEAAVGASVDALQDALEGVAADLMVDIELIDVEDR